MAGFVNANYTAWTQDELREKHVHVVLVFDYDVSVNGIMEHKTINPVIYTSIKKNWRSIMESPIFFFQKDCKTERVYNVYPFLFFNV